MAMTEVTHLTQNLSSTRFLSANLEFPYIVADSGMGKIQMNHGSHIFYKLVAGDPVSVLTMAVSIVGSATQVLHAIHEKKYWAAQILLVKEREKYSQESHERAAIQSIIDTVFGFIGDQIRTSDAPPVHEVEFGTSGWRGVLGDDFTFRNVLLAAEAIVNVLKRPVVLAANKVASWEELQARGCVIGHDNRFMAKEMAELLAGVMAREGIKIYWIGEASTPEVAAVLRRKGAVFSLNLTPSHNPFTDSGLTKVMMLPGSSFANKAFKTRLIIFPERVLGKSLTK